VQSFHPLLLIPRVPTFLNSHMCMSCVLSA
jgi:hypothetical protein